MWGRGECMPGQMAPGRGARGGWRSPGWALHECGVHMWALGAPLSASLSRFGKKQVWWGHQPSLSGPGLAPELADPKLVSEQGVSFPSIRPVAWLLLLSGHSALGPALYLGIVNISRCRARGSMTRL